MREKIVLRNFYLHKLFYTPEQMLNKGCSKEAAADIIFKFSPNVQDKTVIQNMIDKIKNVQYVR